MPALAGVRTRHAKDSKFLAEDDVAHQRRLLRAIDRGTAAADVTTASTREELIEAARSGRFDCIVLDYDIPPHSAPELIAALQPLQPGVPCIVVSASEEQRVVIHSLRTGVADFIPKHEAYQGGSLRARIDAAMKLAKSQRIERRHVNRRLRRLEHQANTDALTGLRNRRAADALLQNMGRRSDRRTTTSIVLIDLDNFKSVNDTFGHDAGDHVLREVGAGIARSIGGADFAARWGGEESLVVRQSTSLADDPTRAVAEARMIRRLAEDLDEELDYEIRQAERRGGLPRSKPKQAKAVTSYRIERGRYGIALSEHRSTGAAPFRCPKPV